jgi:hypothetical protein
MHAYNTRSYPLPRNISRDQAWEPSSTNDKEAEGGRGRHTLNNTHSLKLCIIRAYCTARNTPSGLTCRASSRLLCFSRRRRHRNLLPLRSSRALFSEGAGEVEKFQQQLSRPRSEEKCAFGLSDEIACGGKISWMSRGIHVESK